MSKIRDSLKKLIGRLKEMSNYWLALGALLIPLGFVVLLGKPDIEMWVVYLMVCLGLFCMVMGLINTQLDERNKRKESAMLMTLIASIALKMGVDVQELFDMAGIKQKHKGGKNGTDKSNHPKNNKL
jgi:uncharacterized membrane protein HdeD (DUF308 family)